MLPRSLSDALQLFEKDPLFCNALGRVFVDYYTRLKRTELERFETFIKRAYSIDPSSEATTEWEQNEYLDFF